VINLQGMIEAANRDHHVLLQKRMSNAFALTANGQRVLYFIFVEASLGERFISQTVCRPKRHPA
jgi:hypothetical protein